MGRLCIATGRSPDLQKSIQTKHTIYRTDTGIKLYILLFFFTFLLARFNNKKKKERKKRKENRCSVLRYSLGLRGTRKADLIAMHLIKQDF